MAADLIRWRAQYNLGLDEIDAQHQSLLELINKAWRAIVRRSDPSVVLAVIDELERYTLAHFTAEETFMRVTGYPASRRTRGNTRPSSHASPRSDSGPPRRDPCRSI